MWKFFIIAVILKHFKSEYQQSSSSNPLDPHLREWTARVLEPSGLEKWLTPAGPCRVVSPFDLLLGRCDVLRRLSQDSQALACLSTMTHARALLYAVSRRSLEVLALVLLRALPAATLLAGLVSGWRLSRTSRQVSSLAMRASTTISEEEFHRLSKSRLFFQLLFFVSCVSVLALGVLFLCRFVFDTSLIGKMNMPQRTKEPFLFQRILDNEEEDSRCSVGAFFDMSSLRRTLLDDDAFTVDADTLAEKFFLDLRAFLALQTVCVICATLYAAPLLLLYAIIRVIAGLLKFAGSSFEKSSAGWNHQGEQHESTKSPLTVRRTLSQLPEGAPNRFQNSVSTRFDSRSLSRSRSDPSLRLLAATSGQRVTSEQVTTPRRMSTSGQMKASARMITSGEITDSGRINASRQTTNYKRVNFPRQMATAEGISTSRQRTRLELMVANGKKLTSGHMARCMAEMLTSGQIASQEQMGTPGKTLTSGRMTSNERMGTLGKMLTSEHIANQERIETPGKIKTSGHMASQERMGTPGKMLMLEHVTKNERIETPGKMLPSVYMTSHKPITSSGDLSSSAVMSTSVEMSTPSRFATPGKMLISGHMTTPVRMTSPERMKITRRITSPEQITTAGSRFGPRQMTNVGRMAILKRISGESRVREAAVTRSCRDATTNVCFDSEDDSDGEFEYK